MTSCATPSSARGFSFANPTSRFIGHAVCDDVEWLNGLSNPVSESYHPNRLGHSSGYAPLISPLLTGAVARTTTTSYAARVPASEIAASQRQYADEDASIRPAEFRVPDLTSPATRAAARRHGIDVRRWLARQ